MLPYNGRQRKQLAKSIRRWKGGGQNSQQSKVVSQESQIMTKIERFEEIQGWQKARELVKGIYQATSGGNFAQDYSLKDQIMRREYNGVILSRRRRISSAPRAWGKCNKQDLTDNREGCLVHQKQRKSWKG
jgi:hypothetical protein